MNLFEYDISIIMPIYNAEDFLEESLISILNQDDKKIKYEVLMINDGSTDRSEQICHRYETKYKNFKYYYKENSGVSATRNVGIDSAKGKYILFLDSDDMLTSETLGHVFHLFERFQNVSDILTYPLKKYIDGEEVDHLRSKNYYTEGIFKIDNFTKLNQVTINTVIKNLPKEERIYFNTDLKQSEDALFNTRMVMKNESIIISSKGAYLYRTDHHSTVNNFANPAAIKGMLLDFFNELIKLQKDGELHSYIQSNILYEINWRFRGNVLYPNYLDTESRKKWDNSFQKIMDYINIDTIMNQDHMDIYHKFYFIDKYKGNITIDYDSAGINYYSGKEKFLSVKQFTIVFSKMSKKGNMINVYGFLKSPLLKYIVDDLQLVMRKNEIDQKINLIPGSTDSYYKAKIKVADFYDVNFSIPLDEDGEYEFWVIYKGLEYKVTHYFKESVFFPKEIKLKSTIIDGKVLSYQEKTDKELFKISVSSDQKEIKNVRKLFSRTLRDRKYFRLFTFYKYYELSKNYYSKRNIWLYTDRIGVFDNAFIQFKHDLTKKDKTDRYYIISQEDINDERIKDIPKKNLIIRNSNKHKILFVFSSMVLTSFKDYEEYCPLSYQFYSTFYSIMNFKLIYLQHGVLHAHTPWLYSKSRTGIDRFLVSSKHEAENLIKNYGYNDDELIKTGMPRLMKEANPKINKKDKILFAPSWRISITRGQKEGEWYTDKDEFKNSIFYKEIMSFLTDDRLEKILNESGFEIDIKLHPIFKEMTPLFKTKNEKINVVESALELSEYKVLITDFSSFLFDFIENHTKILMFYPDYDYFVSGNHIYNKLDFDLSPISEEYKDANSLIIKLKKIIETDAELSTEELEFYNEFFYDVVNRKEALYQELISINQ